MNTGTTRSRILLTRSARRCGGSAHLAPKLAATIISMSVIVTIMLGVLSIVINIFLGPVDPDGHQACREKVHCDGSAQLSTRSSGLNRDSTDGLMVNVAAADYRETYPVA